MDNLHCKRFSFVQWLSIIFMAFCAEAQSQEAIETAMITSFRGDVQLVTPQGKQAIPGLIKLKQGDLLALNNAAVRLLYFGSGKEESWQGSGRLEVLKDESRTFGIASPNVKILSNALAKQIARTPAPDGQGRGAATRLRAIATPEAIAKLENTYRQMRMEAVRGDLNPELYLLSGLFELREFPRVEQVLADLQRARPGDMEVGLVVALYQKAMRNSKEGQVR